MVDIALGYRLAPLGSAPDAARAVGPQNPDCVDEDTALATAPPTRIFSLTHIAPALLIHTPHSVVATGHHRNNEAINRVISAFLASPEVARSLIQAEGAHYVAFCRGELGELGAASPDGLAAQLTRGAPIAWLEPQARMSSGDLQVYLIIDPTAKNAVAEQNAALH